MGRSKQETAVWVSSSALVVVSTWKLLQWRARKRARRTVQQAQMKSDCPLVDCNDPAIRESILVTAMKRASKWMALSEDEAKPMVGQVGGISSQKKPLLTLKPDYILKPLITDHRGIREIAFYEAIKMVSTKSKNADKNYHTFLIGKQSTSKTKSMQLQVQSPPSQSTSSRTRNIVGEYFDTFAMALSIFLHDPVVLESESALRKAWRGIKRETEILAKLAKFTAPYYGVMGQSTVDPSTPFGVAEEAHLLLQDLTINFKQPCVMDLKMGDQTYEPDATKEKRSREFGKYPQQAQFGFRIVGMRFYDPAHPLADATGFRCFLKPYGRSLTTTEELKEAFRLYFTGGLVVPEAATNSSKDAITNGEAKSQSETANGDTTYDPTKSPRNGRSKPITSSRPPSPIEKPTIRIRSISSLLVHLRPLVRWFEENKSLRFYASSLLIVYEGDMSADTDVASIKMIDFGRVRREAGGDTGYMHGLNTIQSIFTDLLEEEKRLPSEQSSADVLQNKSSH